MPDTNEPNEVNHDKATMKTITEQVTPQACRRRSSLVQELASPVSPSTYTSCDADDDDASSSTRRRLSSFTQKPRRTSSTSSSISMPPPRALSYSSARQHHRSQVPFMIRWISFLVIIAICRIVWNSVLVATYWRESYHANDGEDLQNQHQLSQLAMQRQRQR